MRRVKGSSRCCGPGVADIAFTLLLTQQLYSRLWRTGTPTCAMQGGGDVSGNPARIARVWEGVMRKARLTLVLLAWALPLLGQGAPPQGAADQPYTVEYYYKVQWGHQQEFLQLFLKNHYPLLQKNVEAGRMLSIK